MKKDLLKRYFENSVTPEEQAVVSQWLMAPENKAEVLDYIESSWLEDNTQESPVASFDAVYNKIVEEAKPVTKVVAIHSRKWLRVGTAAACILFLIAGTWLGYQLKDAQVPDTPDVLTLATASTGKGQRTKLLLNDGSEVYLNAETKLTLPDAHQVMYLEGEAYFNLKSTTSVITIKTKGITTKAKSSQFNISAFDKDSSVVVSVEKGKAEVSRNNETWPLLKLKPVAKTKDSVIVSENATDKPKTMPLVKLLPPLHLRENQAIVFNKDQSASGVIIEDGIEQYSSWKDDMK